MKHMVLLLASLVALALAQSGLQIQNPWVRLVPGPTSGAFMVLLNPTAKPIRIVGVESPVAGKAEIHQTQMVKAADGSEVMQMRRVAFVEVPAGGKLELKPGGHHIMLMMLKAPLKAGQKVKITLKLSNNQSLALEAVVKAQ